ncbi:peptidase [Nitrincola tibetensis]|uniref:Penicillin-binding protein 1A n=1 Tax=Nitrincola tibetensis TaxID=2219697 RepID=A0A364NJP9_9GAMM|nr:penicillin-binding protein 1A [Nitrincola tibetensis]RAU17349.1 peptidase [Nitrincola tibetensis]
MHVLKITIKLFIALLILILISGSLGGYFIWKHFSQNLPDVQELKEVKFQTPLRIFSADGKLIAEYGEQRRTPIDYDQIPEHLIQAILAAEDSRFFDHFGVDIKGLARAGYQLISGSDVQTGGSTITMQVAKNFFLTPARTLERKFTEILLSLRIEKELTKQEIMELYVNKIYLGQRAYGVQAAANIYYGKDISELTLAQIATIAGLPKAPSAANPVSNPRRSIERRNWILGRMLSLGYINDQEYSEAIIEPEIARYHTSDIELSAFYVAEMVRAEMFRLFGEEAYLDGYSVTTTIESDLQTASDQALRKGIRAYGERHGYHGPEAQIKILDTDTEEELSQKLREHTTFADLQAALVINVGERDATVLLRNGEKAELSWDTLKWARKHINVNSLGPAPTKASDIVAIGDVVRVIIMDDERLEFSQLPKVQGAVVALETDTGAIKALSGGYSFAMNNFNRATQAYRQPGSTFKPFLYAAAIDGSYTAATVVNDAPIVIEDVSLQGEWRPENSSRDFSGPTRLREALYRSKNLVSIRLMRDIGVQLARDKIVEFGFEAERTPANLSLSLGSSDATPLQLTAGYAVFANGGYKVEPYFIQAIHNENNPVVLPENSGNAFMETNAGLNASNRESMRIIQASTAYILADILKDVIRRGTGRSALSLNRPDLAGKTGTTNSQRDVWFSGFNRDIVATAWIGFDQPAPLGRREFGGTAALPIWIEFMQTVSKHYPVKEFERPSDVRTVSVDPNTGLLAYPGQSNAIPELFRQGSEPSRRANSPEARQQGSVIESIFDY